MDLELKEKPNMGTEGEWARVDLKVGGETNHGARQLDSSVEFI